MSDSTTTAKSQKALRTVIAIAYAAAIVLGILNGLYGSDTLIAVANFLSSIFIRLFKFIAVPIIAVSIIATLANLSKNKNSGRIFKHTIFYTLSTTILAATIGGALFFAFAPENVAVTGAQSVASVAEKSYLDYIQTVVPDNFVAPFLSANVLSVLIVAFAVGMAIAKLPQGSKHQETLLNFFTGAQEVLFTMVRWLIQVLPLGIFGFITGLIIEVKAGVSLGGLGAYFATVLTANFVQMLVILPLFLILRGLNPLKVARAMFPALTLAFFSKSSAATLPVTLSSAETRMKIRPEVARFVLPICTTINMNGCAAFILITVIYLLQNAGAPIDLPMMLVWILISTLAAVGNAGVPMGCFFLAASLASSMSVPILLMGVILPFYAVIDMIETTLNVWSDSCVAAMVNHDLYGDEGAEK